jgi:hypothetical protein
MEHNSFHTSLDLIYNIFIHNFILKSVLRNESTDNFVIVWSWSIHKQCHMDPMLQSSLILWDHQPMWDLPLRQMSLCGVWMHFWVFLHLWEMLVCTLLSVRFCLTFMLGLCHLEWVKFRFSDLTYWTCVQMFGWVLVSPSSSSIWSEPCMWRALAEAHCPPPLWPHTNWLLVPVTAHQHGSCSDSMEGRAISWSYSLRSAGLTDHGALSVNTMRCQYPGISRDPASHKGPTHLTIGPSHYTLST